MQYARLLRSLKTFGAETMIEVLTSAQMRAVEGAAMSFGRVTGLQLMERAGRGVVDAILDRWPVIATAPDLAVVLCGPGNNGGDGFVIARLLAERGWEVACFFVGDAARLSDDARANYDRWAAMGQVRPWADLGAALREWGDARHPALWIDAVFGTGLSRAVTGEIAEGFRALSVWPADLAYAEGGKWVAVDLPSGLDADTGQSHLTEDERIFYDLTVSFHRAKLGHHLNIGPDLCGDLVIADIGITTLCPEAVRLSEPRLSSLKGGLRRVTHKYSHGHALILGGPAGKTGAARLAARAALRAGAGLVTIAVPRDAMSEYAAHETAVMLVPCDTPEDLAALLEDKRYDRLCIGPAFGVERAAAFLPTVLAGERFTVIDADALTALARDAALMGALHFLCVLTPHGGEFARLFPDLTDHPSKITATEEAATRAGCTVLFKGRDTVIAAPHRQTVLNAATYDNATPWLATAGAGDVLAGIITGIKDVETAAWLHTAAARHFGAGLIAEDLPDALPAVFRALGL